MRLSFFRWLGRRWFATRSAPRASEIDQYETSPAHAPPVVDIDDGDDGDGEDGDDFDFFPEPVRLEITDVFDLHTIAPRDVERVVVEYLEEARRAGFRSVRIIHGKGRGVQRRLVQNILARTPYIRDWADAPPQSGGWGATIAHFKHEKH
ncbi:MAG TPA: Smr/MutS family protein [Pyrinomonadaceae bacterium]|nr:Smr/MutS family protein [Pyrinomonadaceae bacterium]